VWHLLLPLSDQNKAVLLSPAMMMNERNIQICWHLLVVVAVAVGSICGSSSKLLDPISVGVCVYASYSMEPQWGLISQLTQICGHRLIY